MKDTEGKIHPLQAHKKMQALLDANYRDMEQAHATGKKIAWVTGQAPTDILLAADILPAYPENHAALCGARRLSTVFCQIAETHDYLPDLCSYARNNLGFCLSERRDLAGAALPPPDILMAVSMCNTHVKWWEALSRHYRVPLLLLETPFVHDSLSPDDIKRAFRYAENQLKEMVTFLEEFCHRPYDYDRLQQSIANSSKAAKLYAEFLSMAKHVPSPITSFDAFLHLAPMMNLRGYPEAVDYYQLLLDEVKARVRESFSAVGEERYRLYWDNIPVWSRLGWLARKFATYGACAVAAFYPWLWVEAFGRLNPERPLESIAESLVLYYQNKGTASRIDFPARLVKEFQVDGMVAQVSVTCKALVPDQLVIAKEVQRVTGVPMVIIEGDMVDERLFFEAEVERQIDDFISVLAARKHRLT
jgi:benzoyl-CoA reductase/2-hydroxyglutaryl-CoA dehydratase subunit BcrC/BadD/HgdB